MARRRGKKQNGVFTVWSGIRVGLSIVLMVIVVLCYSNFVKEHGIYERYRKYGDYQEVSVESVVPISEDNDGKTDYYHVYVYYEYGGHNYEGIFYGKVYNNSYEYGQQISVCVNSNDPTELFKDAWRYSSCELWLFPAAICFALAAFWLIGILSEVIFREDSSRRNSSGMSRSAIIRRYRMLKHRSLLKASWLGLTGLCMVLTGAIFLYSRDIMLLFGIPILLIYLIIVIVLLVSCSNLNSKHVTFEKDILVSKQQSGSKWLLRGKNGTYKADEASSREILEGEEFCLVRCRGKKMGVGKQME